MPSPFSESPQQVVILSPIFLIFLSRPADYLERRRLWRVVLSVQTILAVRVFLFTKDDVRLVKPQHVRFVGSDVTFQLFERWNSFTHPGHSLVGVAIKIRVYHFCLYMNHGPDFLLQNHLILVNHR